MMKTSTRYLTSLLAALAIGGGVLLAPIASAATSPATTSPTSPTTVATVPAGGTDPLVPFGTEPTVPYRLGYIDPNHDDANTTNGEVDLPF
jgi:hypothetical protein